MLKSMKDLKENSSVDPEEILSMPMDAIVCFCDNVTKRQIFEAIQNGAKTLSEIKAVTGACTSADCKELSPRRRCCSPEIKAILKQASSPDGSSHCDCLPERSS